MRALLNAQKASNFPTAISPRRLKIQSLMKSERRHELQKNILADWLGAQVEGVKPYATQIAIAVIVVVAVAAGSYWYMSGVGRQAADAWSQYFAAFNQRQPEEALAKVMTNQPGSEAALWAAQSVGDMNLAQGSMLMFSDRAEAEKRLEKATEALEQVRASATDPMLKARALLSLGKLYEAKMQPEEARKHYEQAADASKNTVIGKYAAAQARRLSDERQVELLAWFAKQTPKRPAPLPGMGGGLPGLPNDLPDRPDLSFPGSGFGEFGFGTPGATDQAFPPPLTPPTGDAATPGTTLPDAPTSDTPPAESPPPDAPATSPTDAPASSDPPPPAADASTASPSAPADQGDQQP